MTLRRRETYRHGDLRHALLEAALELAREGGPEGVVLREATRRAGVAPNAAYRHFANRQALLDTVRGIAQGRLARAMEDEMARLTPLADAAQHARALLRAIGSAYVAFAQREPGLFRTAFAGTGTPVRPVEDPQRFAASAHDPFDLLAAALDAMVDAGVLPPERRHSAEFLAWSAVHGFTTFLLDGPLRQATHAERSALGERLLAMVERGL